MVNSIWPESNGGHAPLPAPNVVKHRVEWTTPDEPTVWLAVFYTA